MGVAPKPAICKREVYLISSKNVAHDNSELVKDLFSVNMYTYIDVFGYVIERLKCRKILNVYGIFSEFHILIYKNFKTYNILFYQA